MSAFPYRVWWESLHAWLVRCLIEHLTHMFAKFTYLHFLARRQGANHPCEL